MGLLRALTLSSAALGSSVPAGVPFVAKPSSTSTFLSFVSSSTSTCSAWTRSYHEHGAGSCRRIKSRRRPRPVWREVLDVIEPLMCSPGGGATVTSASPPDAAGGRDEGNGGVTEIVRYKIQDDSRVGRRR